MVSHLSLIRGDDDSELVPRIRAGDTDEFSRLYLSMFSRVMRLAENILHDRALAEDAAHDAFAIVWERRSALRDDDKLESMILKMVQNNALKMLRHQRVVNKSELGVYDSESGAPGAGEVNAPADEMIDSSLLSREIHNSLNDLPELERKVVMLRWRNRLTLAETASALQLSVKAVRVRLARAEKKLKGALGIFKD